MKITQEIIDALEKALDMRKKNGEEIWNDGDEISVNVAGTFAADKFITLTNKTKNPVVSSNPPEACGPGGPLQNQAGDGR